MEAFKYCAKEVMQKLLSREELRVGTIYGWRNGKGIGEMVQDAHDGSTELGGNLIVHDLNGRLLEEESLRDFGGTSL
jgi:hypothetical protein